jgi:hypothetical protein
MNDLKPDQLTHFDVQYDSDAKTSLYNMGRWTRFLTISIFIFSAFFFLIVLFVLLGSTAFKQTLSNVWPGIDEMWNAFYFAIVIGTLVVLAIYVSAFYFLYVFSTKIKRGLLSEDTITINGGLKSLKIYFIISTILSAIALLVNFFSTIL